MLKCWFDFFWTIKLKICPHKTILYLSQTPVVSAVVPLELRLAALQAFEETRFVITVRGVNFGSPHTSCGMTSNDGDPMPKSLLVFWHPSYVLAGLVWISILAIKNFLESEFKWVDRWFCIVLKIRTKQQQNIQTINFINTPEQAISVPIRVWLRALLVSPSSWPELKPFVQAMRFTGQNSAVLWNIFQQK